MKPLVSKVRLTTEQARLGVADMRTWCGAVCVAVVLALAACTGEAPSAPVTVGPPPEVHHPPAAVPADRDERAVLAALGQLDACALLDPAAAAVPGYPANLRPWSQGPHRCLITRKRGDDEIRVKLGDRFTAEAKFDQVPLSLGRAKAYLWSSSKGDMCFVRIPVSFELSIEFWAAKGSQSTGSDLCTAAKGFAAAAATKLANPDTVTAGETMPMAHWDACTLLGAALGAEAERYPLRLGSFYGLDECSPDGSQLDTRPPDPELRLTLEYQPDPAAEHGAKVDTIGGKRVRIYDGSGCTLAWSLGPSRSAYPHATHQQVQLRAGECTTGRRLAESLITVLDSSPPAAAAPQRPLTYRPDEPDAPKPAACVDLRPNISGSCQPFVPVGVPGGAAEILRAADADPNVNCAFAFEAVRAHFGAQLVPVTAGGACVFVEPTHSLEIEINSSSDTKLEFHDGEDQENARNHRMLSLSGRAAVYYEYQAPHLDLKYHLNVSPRTGTGDGVIFGAATFYPARGMPDKSPADTSRSTKLELVMADITARFFA